MLSDFTSLLMTDNTRMLRLFISTHFYPQVLISISLYSVTAHWYILKKSMSSGCKVRTKISENMWYNIKKQNKKYFTLKHKYWFLSSQMQTLKRKKRKHTNKPKSNHNVDGHGCKPATKQNSLIPLSFLLAHRSCSLRTTLTKWGLMQIPL